MTSNRKRCSQALRTRSRWSRELFISPVFASRVPALPDKDLASGPRGRASGRPDGARFPRCQKSVSRLFSRSARRDVDGPLAV